MITKTTVESSFLKFLEATNNDNQYKEYYELVAGEASLKLYFKRLTARSIEKYFIALPPFLDEQALYAEKLKELEELQQEIDLTLEESRDIALEQEKYRNKLTFLIAQFLAEFTYIKEGNKFIKLQLEQMYQLLTSLSDTYGEIFKLTESFFTLITEDTKINDLMQERNRILGIDVKKK